MISVIIRTKNEERWISACLASVFKQDHKDFEVIIVDNESTDKTLEKVSRFKVRKVVHCRNFRPGLALNLGIREARGEFIACLSGHCIPVNERWLSSLERNFSDPEEPLAFTPDSDKRDLSIIFGLDRRIQRKDSFFHNANSMLRKSRWDEVPFDELATNIEDRIWAEKMIQRGRAIVYEPEASVYHYHGIHQNGDARRCANVVRILESLSRKARKGLHVDLERLHITAVIPAKGPSKPLGGKPLIEYTIRQALGSRLIKEVFVSTEDRRLAAFAEKCGARAPFLRDKSLSSDFVDIEKVLQSSLEKIEALKVHPDIVVYLEETFPFRPKRIIDEMIAQLIQNGFDSVIAARKEFKSVWKEEEGKVTRIDSGYIPRQYKEPCFIDLKGLCTVTYPEFIRQGSLLGEKIGIFDVEDPYSLIEVRGAEDFRMAEKLIGPWGGAGRGANR